MIIFKFQMINQPIDSMTYLHLYVLILKPVSITAHQLTRVTTLRNHSILEFNIDAIIK